MSNNYAVQFRVVLLGVLPMIWRRFLISDDATFWDLHVAIQDAMGWEDRHLHCFRVTKPSSGYLESIGVPEHGGPSPFLPGWNIRFDEYLSPDMPLFLYEYDFGDSWLHEVVLERIFETDVPLPVCTEGEGDGPPEDCGGAPMYQETLTGNKRRATSAKFQPGEIRFRTKVRPPGA